MDHLVEFVGGMPGWVGRDGFPLSWQHYHYGLAFLRRNEARKKLVGAEIARAVKTKDEDYQSWRRSNNMLAGFE